MGQQESIEYFSDIDNDLILLSITSFSQNILQQHVQTWQVLYMWTDFYAQDFKVIHIFVSHI